MQGGRAVLDKDAEKQLRVLQIISFALISGVMMFAAVVTFLTSRADFAPFDLPVPIVVVLGVGVLSLVAASRLGAYLRNREIGDPGGHLQSYSISVIVSQALRESVGLLGIAVGFITGNTVVTLGFAAVSGIALMMGLPKRHDLEALLRRSSPRTNA
jgi:F0F1-type ATP synthase membrane subunit c/vacuolar-type H+-ATPase subunit K